jgi:2-keto-3-deoxy-6-phosphogluconate aldolase
VRQIHERGALVVMGVGNAEEAIEAKKRGVDAVKCFPFEPKDDVIGALKGPMPGDEAKRFRFVDLTQDATYTPATFTNVYKFLEGLKGIPEASINPKKFSRPLMGEKLVESVRAVVGNMPIVITGGVTAEMIEDGILERLNVGAAMSMKAPADAKRLNWVFESTPDARDISKNIRDLLKGGFTAASLAELDSIIDRLIRDVSVTCAELLTEGSAKAVSAAIIERMALPDVASELMNNGSLAAYLDIARKNPEIKAKAMGVEKMAKGLVKGAKEPFKAFNAPSVLEEFAECDDAVLVKGIERGTDIDVKLVKEGTLNTATKPSRTTILEQHPNADQYFMVEEGSFAMLAAESQEGPMHAYVLKAGDAPLKVKAGAYHIAVNLTETVKFRVYNRIHEGDKMKTDITCIGRTADLSGLKTPARAADAVAVHSTHDETQHPLLTVIDEFTVPVDWEKGPGVVEPLTDSQLREIYDAVNLFHQERIEIFIHKAIGISPTMKQAIGDINKNLKQGTADKGGKQAEDIIICHPAFESEEQLAKLLKNPAQGKRIILTADGVCDADKFIALGDLLKNTRTINVKLPDNYAGLKANDKTFYQAWAVNLGILGRLIEPDSGMYVRNALVNLLKGSVDGDVNEYIDNLARPENQWKSPADRIGYFLGRMVRLSYKIAEEYELLRLRMKAFWTAA